MAPRASAQAAARKQAYPPSKQSSGGPSHSPEARRVRSTRSGSRDLDASDNEGPGYRRLRRSTRQASIDSAASVANSVSESLRVDNRRSKSSRVEESADLSVVNEDVESEQDGEGEERRDSPEDVEFDDSADEDIDQELEAQLLQSSAGVLESPHTSGDSDMGYDSESTTQSEEESRELGPVLVQFLPDLLTSSCKILDQVAPPGLSFEEVESIVTELKTPASIRAIRFRRDEQAFGNDRQFYGSDPYINPARIYKALFGNKAEEISKSKLDYGPDPILHAANLATLVKDIFITARDDPEMQNKLLRVDPLFPELFLKGFHPDAKLGYSNLENMTFELSLEIRTQCVITALRTDRTGLDPERILLSLFFHKYTTRQTSPQISYFDETWEHGQLREIMRNVSPNSEEQDDIIRSRVKEIQIAFQPMDDGIMVDFDRLDEMFPWSGFLEGLAVWSRKRLNEIKRDVIPPEGVDYMLQSLTKAMKADNSEAEVVEPPSPPVVPQHQNQPRTITPSNAGQNLYSNAQNVLLLEKLKRQMSIGEAVPSRVSSSAQSRTRTVNQASSTARIPPTVDNPESMIRSSQDYVNAVNKYTREGNKENRPSQERPQDSSSKPSVPERQMGATPNPGQASAPPSNKRPRPDMDEELQDNDFQEDDRVPDPRRRKSAPVPTYGRPMQMESSPPEMIRYDPSDDRLAQAKLQRKEQFNIPPQRGSVTGVDNETEEEEEEDVGDDGASSVMPPSFQAVAIAARLAVMQRTQHQTQRRTFWTAADEDHLASLIEEHGTSWAMLERIGGFETPRNQVALKDKARNMKVAFLKSGVPLPDNFEKIALGAKEIAVVQRVRPEWRP